MPYKEILSAVAISLTFIAFYPYLRGIAQGTIKPHVFSWVIWGTTTFVVFLAQLNAHGGVGAWPIGISGAITIVIAILAFTKRADVGITKVDWLFFASALSSLPLWYLTSSPALAVVVHLQPLIFLALVQQLERHMQAHIQSHCHSLLYLQRVMASLF